MKNFVDELVETRKTNQLHQLDMNVVIDRLVEEIGNDISIRRFDRPTRRAVTSIRSQPIQFCQNDVEHEKKFFSSQICRC